MKTFKELKENLEENINPIGADKLDTPKFYRRLDKKLEKLRKRKVEPAREDDAVEIELGKKSPELEKPNYNRRLTKKV